MDSVRRILTARAAGPSALGNVRPLLKGSSLLLKLSLDKELRVLLLLTVYLAREPVLIKFLN